MAIIKGGTIESTELISTTLRYVILVLLMLVSFVYIKNVNIQFIIFIVLLTTYILGSTFLIKDITGNATIMSKISAVDPLISIRSNNSIFLMAFLGSIGIGIIMKIISLVFFITTFSYGRKQLNTKSTTETQKLSSYNESILKKYLLLFIISTTMIFSLLVLIFMTYSSPEVQIIIKNMVALLLSVGILISVAIEMYYSVIFFKIPQNNGVLYELITTNDS